MRSTLILLVYIFSLSQTVLSAILDCKRHSELDEVIHCELSEKSDEQLSISGYKSYGNQHYDDAESISIGYKNVTKYFPIGVGEVFKKMKALEVSATSLSTITKPSFTHMENLKELKLNHNEIEDLQSDLFKDLPNLLHLNLANNKIAKLNENLLINLQNLKRFDASHNNIKKLSGSIFKNNHELKEINLRGNKIAEVDLKIFKTQKWNLSVFDLRGNSGRCDLRFEARDGIESFVNFIERAENLCGS